MFEVDEKTMEINMHKGDTGSFWFELELDPDDVFVAGDVAIFEVWGNGARMIHREFDLQPETPDEICVGDGKFLIAFRNSDTDTWAVASYNTEIRVSLNPVRANGDVVDGNVVRTVVQSTLNLRPVFIDI